MKKKKALIPQPLIGHIYRIWHSRHGPMTVEVLSFRDAVTAMVEVLEAPLPRTKKSDNYQPPKEGATIPTLWRSWIEAEDVTT